MGEDLVLLQELCAYYRKVLEWGWELGSALGSRAMAMALNLFGVEMTPLWTPVVLWFK